MSYCTGSRTSGSVANSKDVNAKKEVEKGD